MHRAIGYLSKRFVQLRPGEGKRVSLTFLYFFLIITAYYVIKPVSRSMALGELGSRMVPYVDLICAIVMGPVVTLFARLVDRMSKARLVKMAFLVVAALLVIFWRLLSWQLPWVVASFYVWVSIFSVLVVTLFWLVANDLYRPREAKRLFGFIGSGGILGGIVGSSIAAVGAQLVGTPQLLLVSASLIVGCWLVVQELWKLAPERAAEEQRPARHGAPDTFLGNVGGFARLLLQSRYLLLLVALVGLNKLCATLMYYQFNPYIEQVFTDQDARTTFTSLFFGAVNVLAFVIQFFLTSMVLRRWGLGLALLALPVGLLGGTLGLLALPVLWVAAWVELYDGSLNYSLQQTSKELLYLPIDRSIRYKVKPFIDMVVFRFGKGIAAILGIVLMNVCAVPSRCLGYVAVPLLVAWVVVAFQLRREYVATIRTMLQARAARRPDSGAAAHYEDGGATPLWVSGISGHPVADAAEPYGTLTDGRFASVKLDLVEQWLVTKAPQPSKELLRELAAYEVHGNGQQELTGDAGWLRQLIGDAQAPMAKRRQGIRLLARYADQSTVDYLLGTVIVANDVVLRHDAVKSLVRLRMRNPELDFPGPQLRRLIAEEIANYRRIVQVSRVFRQQFRSQAGGEPSTMALLRVLMEEAVEQVFRLLMLLYRADDIHLVYEQMRAPDPYLRTDAIELLDNLVDPEIRHTLMPILDEDRFLGMLEDEPMSAQEPATAYRVLQEAIWDHNSWLSVTTLCAVGQLRLNPMRQELERASQHTTPLISSAARVALMLSAH